MFPDGPQIVHGDAHWMRRALTWARRYAGRTWPNPTVGACLVRDGRLLGEAVHEKAGEAHAEAALLRRFHERGESIAGTTLYVTLEPCHHHGRTPPCTRAIAEAGVARVVFAVQDQSPRHHDGGARWLREQGIQVDRGPLGYLAWELNHPFFETAGDDQVHMTLKLALTLDGRMAPRAGRIEDPEQRRITGPKAQRRVHRIRAGASAVMVGRGTVQADHPRLGVRLVPSDGSPRPVILDPGLVLDPEQLPPGSLVLRADGGSEAAGAAAVREGGHAVATVSLRKPGRFDWDAVDRALLAEDLGIVLVEAGPTLALDLLAARRPERIHLYLAPKVMGGDGPQLPGLAGLESHYRTWRHRRVGSDLEWVLRRRDLPDPVL